MNTIKAYLSFLIAFLVIDGVWITFFAKPLYDAQIGVLLNDKPSATLIIFFYLFYSFAVIQLTVLKADNLKQVQFNAAILGAVTYGTYAVTNHAMLKGWTTTLLITDIIWGIIVTTLCACVSFWAGQSKQPHAKANH